MKSGRSLGWFWMSVVLVSGLVAVEMFQLLGAHRVATSEISCLDPERGCRLEAAGIKGEMRFDGYPQALRPFELQVRAPGARTVHASFSMVGMDMGPNRYELLAAKDGTWTARVVLPACVSGRRDWVVDLYVDGTLVRIPFVTGK